MPAAPAGRVPLPARGGTDRPCASTRRGFVLGGGALLASMLLPAARAPRAIAAATTALDDAAYWAFADRMQDALDPYWRDGMYRPERSMLNATMLLTHSGGGARGPHRPGAARRPRAGARRPAVQRAGVGEDARRPGPRATCPGGGTG